MTPPAPGPIARLLVGSVGLLMSGVLLYGLARDFPLAHLLTDWSAPGVLRDHLAVLGGTFAGLYLVARLAPRPDALAAGLLALMAAAAFGLGALAAVLLSLAVGLALGLLLLGPPAPERRGADLALALTTGLAALAAVIQLIAHVGVNYPAFYLALALAALWGARRRLRPVLADAAAGLARPPARDGDWWKARLAVAVFAALMALIGAYAARPEMTVDALMTHLTIPRYLADNGQWHFDIFVDPFALMPKMAVWLFTPALVLGGEPGAKLMNFAAFGVLCWLLAEALRPRLGGWLPWLAAAALAATPLTLMVASALLEEVGTALWALGAVVLLLRDWERPGLRSAVGIFLLLGAAVGAKYHGLYFGTIGLLAMFRLFAAMPAGRALRAAAAGTAVFLAVGILPYALAWIWTGNPVFPYLNATFRSPYTEAADFMDSRWSGHAGWDLLYGLTFDTGRYFESEGGTFGFQFLLLLPMALAALPFAARGRRAGLWVPALVGAAFTATLLSQVQYIRYLFYVMPLALLLLPGAAEALGRRGRAVLGGILLLSVALNLTALRALPIPAFSLHDLLRPPPVAADLPYQRAAVAAINAMSGRDARVWFTGEPLSAGLLGRSLASDAGLRHRLFSAADPAEVGREFRRARVTHVVAPPLQKPDSPIERFLAKGARMIDLAAGGRLFLLPPSYALGELLRLGESGIARDFMLRGWSMPEVWGVWTVGAESVLRLPWAEPPGGAVRLVLAARGLLSPMRSAQEVEVAVGGVAVGRWRFTSAQTERVEMLLPADLVAGRETLEVTLRQTDLRYPAEIGLAPDPRPLGIAIHSVQLLPAE
ncbi:MAG TPA: hypothetical protein VED40_17415 [Azospirillaceae bacterium]|nr:hypothetical protein [Azospirillaceae bacterium]